MRFLVAAACLLALTACGSGSNPGVAARVGNVVISSETLGAYVDRALAIPEVAAQVGDDRAAYVRARLNRLIEAVLTEQAARRLGIPITEDLVRQRFESFAASAGGVAALETQAAQQGVPRADLRREVRHVAVTEAVNERLSADEVVPEARLREAYQANIGLYDQARVAHILVPDQASAGQVLARVRAGEDFATLAGQVSQDESSKGQGGDLGLQGKGALESALDQLVFSTPVGGVAGPVRSRLGWHVIKVLERRTTPFSEVRADLRRQVLARQTDTERGELLTEVARGLRISVNPRFGRWDGAQRRVLPPPDDLSAPVSPEPALPAAPQPSPTP